MKLLELLQSLDEELISTYKTYIDFHTKLNEYRGKKVGENVQEINEILKNIQISYDALSKVFYFIHHRYQFAKDVAREYEVFIEDLKKNGAVNMAEQSQTAAPEEVTEEK